MSYWAACFDLSINEYYSQQMYREAIWRLIRIRDEKEKVKTSHCLYLGRVLSSPLTVSRKFNFIKSFSFASLLALRLLPILFSTVCTVEMDSIPFFKSSSYLLNGIYFLRLRIRHTRGHADKFRLR